MTWRHQIAEAVNLALRPSGMKLVRASSIDDHLARGHVDIALNGHTFKGDPRQAAFWTFYSKNGWEPETLAMLRRVLTPSSVYWDIGAWIGPTVLGAAPYCAAVYAFEPDPLAYASLAETVTKNAFPHVRTFNMAVTAVDGVARMRSFGTGLGDSMSSLLPTASSEASCTVTTVSLDTLLTRLSCPPPDVLKIDIEGGEFELVPAIRTFLEQHRPTIYLSVHAPFLPADQRATALSRLAAAVDLPHYSCDAHRDGSLIASCSLSLQALPSSWMRDEFGSLLLCPR
jgi:FkbM family methyltransferase